MFRRISTQIGFTLIELIIVISLITIIALIVIPPFLEFRRTQVLSGETESVISLVNLARSRTLAAKNDINYGIHFSADEVTVFPGDNYVDGGADNLEVSLSAGAVISDISLSDGGPVIVFERLTGFPDVIGTVTVSLSSDPSQNNVIIINEAGIAYEQNP